MLFDDRLATVLRYGARSETAARTQYRQLLDLLGSMPRGTPSVLIEPAYDRLAELAGELPSAVQSAILRAPGLRLRNPALVSWLAESDPQAAAAAMATAQLAEGDWLQLIPRLPVTARGFLRHRRDLPFSARQVLERLGVKDLVLPEPDDFPRAIPLPDVPEPLVVEAPVRAEAEAGIGALVRRIEAFQRARREGSGTPQLPLGDAREPEPVRRTRGFDFATDELGEVTWADPAMAPLVVGLTLGARRPGAVAQLDDASARALARRLPLRSGVAQLAGSPDLAGTWRIDAAPVFVQGRFVGYEGRMRRPAPAPRPHATAPAGTDRMRQLLHELRTPVGAIQGFAELIQQQLFGPAPNEYRALAAAVAVDAARLLAGFDEIDRLAKLESGAAVLDQGWCRWNEAMDGILRRLEGVLRPRSARIEFAVQGEAFVVGLTEGDAQQLAWRLLATLAGALAPGEVIDLVLTSDARELTLVAELPAALLDDGDLFAATAPAQQRAISAGMFGTGFTLRLARAEAAAAGGALARHDDTLRLVLPVLTAQPGAHTVAPLDKGGRPAA